VIFQILKKSDFFNHPKAWRWLTKISSVSLQLLDLHNWC
jgi:hypothetical protein